MAQYNTLPIYKATYDVLLRVMHAVSHFPREYKYSLGEKIQNEIIELVIYIYKANSTKNKVEFLTKMQEQIQLVYLLLRISHDMKLMPTQKYAGIVKMIDEVSCQAKGWLRVNEKLREPVDAKA
ncbi:four helix bundle protein [bacterium]|nr:four helix bundle protein [bacterium]